MQEGKSEFWKLIEPLVEKQGMKIFEIEVPSGSSGVLRVLISGKGGEAGSTAGVGIGDCTRIAKAIIEIEGVDKYMPGNTVLEVSSPGVNRRLTRREHFEGAVGERVKLTARSDEGKKRVVRGKIVSFDGETIGFHDEVARQDISLPLSQIEDARVDFLFK